MAWSLFTVLTAGAPATPWPLAVVTALRALMGVASAAALPCTSSALAEWVPAADRGKATALVYGCFNVGTVLVSLGAPALAAVVGCANTFVFFGGVGFLAAAVFEAVKPAHRGPAHRAKAAGGATNLRFGRLFERDVVAQILCLTWAHVVIGFGFFTLQSWIPLYVSNDLGVTDLRTAGLIAAGPWLATAVAAVGVGSIADRLLAKGLPTPRVRQIMMSCATFSPAACLTLVSFLESGLGALALLIFAMVFQAFSYPGYHAYILDVCGDNSGFVLALTNSFGIVAGIVGNIGTGFLVAMTGNFSLVFRLLAVMYLSSGVMWNLFVKGQKLELGEAGAR